MRNSARLSVISASVPRTSSPKIFLSFCLSFFLSFDSKFVGPAVFQSGPLNLMEACPTGPLRKITKIRAASHLTEVSPPTEACHLTEARHLTEASHLTEAIHLTKVSHLIDASHLT